MDTNGKRPSPTGHPGEDLALHEMAERIQDRADLVQFLRALSRSRTQRPERWENQDLPAFLDALAAWTEDLDGYFESRGEAIPQNPSWKLLATMLLAARVYE
jgi:hypothetical protein